MKPIVDQACCVTDPVVVAPKGTDSYKNRVVRAMAISACGVMLCVGHSGVLAQDADRPVTRLSPQIREVPLTESVNAIPRSTIETFLTGNRIIDADVYENAPYLLSSVSGSLIMGAGDEVLLRGNWETVYSSYDIFRPGALYKDPHSDEELGLEAIHLGTVEVTTSAGDDIKRGTIRDNRLELKAGDRLLPRESTDLQRTFQLTDPESTIEGVIIGLLGDKSMVAQYDAVVLNLGARDGIRVGDVLGIYQSDGIVKDPTTNKSVTLQGGQTGEVMVYRNFEKVSYGLILNSTQPSSINYLVKSQ